MPTLRSRLGRFGTVVAAMAALGASVVPAASGAPVTRAAAGSPATPSVAPLGGPLALPAQSAWQPYALQVVEAMGNGPDAASAAQLAARLDAGESTVAVAGTAVRTRYHADLLVDSAYEDLLGREPDAGGAAYWKANLAAGGSAESMLGLIAASAEFRAHNPTPADRVQALYQALLHRAPDPGGSSYWSALLSGGTSPMAVVGALARTREYGSIVTSSGYSVILQRPADPSGWAFWVGRMQAGLGQIDVWTQLAASAELQNFGCDPIVGSSQGAGTCMLPWPNDHLTVPDASTGTGRRLALKASFLPANSAGTRISPVQLNRSDGFSPGSTLMVQVPGIDLAATGAPTVDDIGASTDADSPIVIVDAASGERVPLWAELDVHAPYAHPSEQLLLIHPARNLADGHHYLVGLRNLRRTGGALIAANPAFAAFRDSTPTHVPGAAARFAELQPVFEGLTSAGVARHDLYLAWDFTVASTNNLAGRMLHIRDDAFARLGSAAPSFTVDTVTASSRPDIARVVEGTFQVPNYLTGTGQPGSTFNEDAAGLPQVNGSFTAKFRCVVPTAALTTAARPSLYGHGLFGSLGEVTAGNVQDMAAEHDFVFCGTLWSGMSGDDVPVAAGILGDLSTFAKLADRVQQGVLNFLFLGRLMKSPQGLVSNAAFQQAGGQPAIDTSELYYDGNSQGGILGGMATAVATDWTKAVLGVSGMNYSLLLPRSTDFATFEQVMTPAYPDELQRALGLAAIQLEWDRAEPDGYANHITSDPLPGTPSHKVLMQIAFGDHQVTNVSADTEARTIGASTHCPALAEGRSPGDLTLWGVPCIGAYPFAGSAIVYWDSGSDAPPLANVPPPSGDTVATHDPHEDPRRSPVARNQKSDFLSPDSVVTNVCGANPCTAPPT